MLKILDLCAGTQSVRKALTEMFGIKSGEQQIGDPDFLGGGFMTWFDVDLQVAVEYIGIDIYSPEYKNLIFDLTQDNIVEKLKKVLPKDGTPDFIGASPVCNKFSTATTGKGGNSYFIHDKENQRLIPRTDFSIVKHNKMCDKKERGDEYQKDAMLAMKLHENTKAIIESFGVPFILENPRTSLAVKTIHKDFVPNHLNYCMYGNYSKKPTTFLSNVEIDLLKCNHKGKHEINIETHVGKYDQRAVVPPKAIISAIKQVLNV